MENRGFDWGILALLVLILGLFLFLGCASPQAGGNDEPAGWLEVRVEAGSGEAGAKGFKTADGEMVWFGPSSYFPLSFVGKDVDGSGLPAVSFEVAREERDTFRGYTERNVGKRMGVFAGGALLTAPTLVDALPGKGIISGGSGGWDATECDRIRRMIRSHEPPPQGAAMLLLAR